MKHLVFSFFLFFSSLSFSQTRIIVESSDYKNEGLIFYKISDYITHRPDTILKIKTDKNGAFDAEIIITETAEIFSDLGVYKCSFYAEPNRDSYKLILPEKRNKTKVEELNIFFEPITVSFGIKDKPKNDLNDLIASFDKKYDLFLVQNFDSIYHFPKSQITQTFENYINNYYSEINNLYFETYYKYRIYELKFLGPNRSSNSITHLYFNSKPIFYNNPSYMRLFNLMYNDFFNWYALTNEGRWFENSIKESRSIEKIKKNLSNSLDYNDLDLNELIILKGIHDEYFHPRQFEQIHFPKPQLNLILDSISNYSSVANHRKIASNIIKKELSKNLEKGSFVPEFKLQSLSGDSISLKDFRGKYVYLNFMRTDIVASMESMDRLINFYKYHKEEIEVVSIFTDENSFDIMKLDTAVYRWPILILGDNKELLSKFNQITWPQFHLINPKGQIIMSPAPSLEENFEIKFFELIDRKDESR